MEHALQKFVFKGQGIRVVDGEREPWFVVADIAKVLGLTQVRNHHLTYLDENEKGAKKLSTPGGKQTLNVVNESGLWGLTFRSRKPEAKKFRQWLTNEVIPSIRKHGGYLTPEKTSEILNDPDRIIELAQNLKEERKKRQEIEQEKSKLQPKAEYHDKVLSSEDIMPVKVIAKELGTGPRKLNQFLHNHGVIYKQGGLWYVYYKYQDKGYARYSTYTRNVVVDGSGTQITKTYHHLKWTEKGRHLIHKLWNKARKQSNSSTPQVKPVN